MKSNIFGNMRKLSLNWEMMTGILNTISRKIGMAILEESMMGTKTPISRKVAKLAHDWMERMIAANRKTSRRAKKLRANQESVVMTEKSISGKARVLMAT
jgi:hypothetical protein